MSEIPKPLVLVVDDEPQIRRLLTVTLEANGYRVLAAGSGSAGLALAAQHRPAIIVLDLGLPDLSGQEVLRRIREWSRVPVVILSVQDDEAGKVAALDGGADDYVTKPFNSAELLARLRVALRHATQPEAERVYQAENVVVDLATRQVTVKGRSVSLTATEYNLLRLLVRHAGRVITHRQLLTEVWGPGAVEQTHYLRVYVAHLREKLEADPAQPTLILTEPGIGYRLQAAG
ncbi:MAG TPA: response regulator [Verrucomicrobiae bacterium]|nr:response regulator [Verrucomicrobiae bacterium]